MLPLKLLDKREAPQQREKKNFFPFSRNFSSDIYISLSSFFLPNWATISTPPLFLSRDEIWKREDISWKRHGYVNTRGAC